MLSNRMTAKSRDENPDSQANKSTENVIRLLHPAVLLFITAFGDFILSTNLFNHLFANLLGCLVTVQTVNECFCLEFYVKHQVVLHRYRKIIYQ